MFGTLNISNNIIQKRTYKHKKHRMKRSCEQLYINRKSLKYMESDFCHTNQCHIAEKSQIYGVWFLPYKSVPYGWKVSSIWSLISAIQISAVLLKSLKYMESDFCHTNQCRMAEKPQMYGVCFLPYKSVPYFWKASNIWSLISAIQISALLLKNLNLLQFLFCHEHVEYLKYCPSLNMLKQKSCWQCIL